MNHDIQRLIAGLILTLVNVSTYASSAHTHGSASIMLAIEGNTVLIEFESPAADILGFEHSAETDNEKQQLAKAKTLLNDTTRLFSFNNANCQLHHSEIDFGSAANTDTPHDHKHEHEHKNTHSEISATYEFTCKATNTIDSITIAIQEAFPSIHHLNAQWISETKQGSTTLKPTANVLTLK